MARRAASCAAMTGSDPVDLPPKLRAAVIWMVFLLLAPLAVWLTVAIAGAGGDPSAARKAEARAAVRARLKDPDSARFDLVRVHADGVCGTVNARNAFGGYAGPQRFVVTSAGRVFLERGDPGFRAAFVDGCAGD